MVAAAEKTATLIEDIILSDGLIINLSSVTTVTADDWIVLSKMEATRFGMALLLLTEQTKKLTMQQTLYL